MIEASFDRGMDRSAMASGAYQYDTGQRLRMHGLPSPQELAESDAFLSGDLATMQVHFGMKGDSQTQARLALWEEETQCWAAMIPDEYLQTAENVHAYIYVSYGADADGNGRTKTMYELVFRPIERPAPNNVATNDQWEAWAQKAAEMDLTLDALQAAEASARAAQAGTDLAAQQAALAAEAAREAGQAADAQLARLQDTAARWSGMTVRTAALDAGMPATAQLLGGVLTYGLPSGAKGEKGDPGDTGPADIALEMTDGVLRITPRAQ